MSGDDEPTSEDQFAALLAACDEAVAAGVPAASFCAVTVPPAWRPRLERHLGCMHFLRQLWPLPNAPRPDEVPAPSRLGRFTIRRELGRGSYGVVFLADDPHLGREVALKIPRAEVLVTAELRARFHHEARAAAGLDHPHIVPVYEAGELGAICYIASGYCPGITLAAWLQARGEPVPFASAAAFLATLADAVQHAHSRGVLHRDLKPANILLLSADSKDKLRIEHSALDTWLPKITDFGLAKLLLEGDHAQTRTGVVLGTPGYMAPEQAAGRSKDISTAVDVFALGVILYEVLTGRPPFQGATALETLRNVETAEPAPPSRLRPGMPRDLETICLKCLQKDPRQRYASAAALAEDLRRFGAGQPIAARPVSSLERLGRWCRRNPALAAMSVLAGLALVSATAVSISFALYQSLAAARLRDALEEAETKSQLLEETNQSLEATDLQRREGLRLSAGMAFDRGVRLGEEGDAALGMLWLARSLEIAPAEDAAFQQAVRPNLAGWLHHVPPLVAVFTHQQQTHAATVAFSPDGKSLVTGSHDGTAQLLEVGTGRPLGPPLHHRGAVVAVAFSPDARTVLTGSEDHTAQRWDAGTGRPLGPPLVHGATVRTVLFSPDGETLLTAGVDKTARLWQTATGRPLGAPLVHARELLAAAFSPDGKWVVTGGGNYDPPEGEIRWWDAHTGQPLGPPVPQPSRVRVVAFSPDGSKLVTGGDDQGQLWDAGKRQPLGPALRHPKAVLAAAFSPDGKAMVTGGMDPSARLWDAGTGEARGLPLAHHGPVPHVAFSPDGRRVLTGSHDNTARLWDAGSGKPVSPPLRHPAEVVAATFLPDGHSVLTASHDRTFRLWDSAPLGQPYQGSVGSSGWVQGVRFLDDGRSVWTASIDQVIQLHDAASCQPMAPALPRQGWEMILAIRSDGKAFLARHRDQTTQVWDGSTAEPLSPPLPHNGGVLSGAFSPDGGTVLTGGKDSTARLWDARTGQPLGSPLPHPAPVQAVAVSPDGQTLLTGCGEDSRPAGEARLWDARSGQPRGPALEHQGMVQALAFCPDGRLVLTGSMDQTAQLWDAATGRRHGPPLRHRAEVMSVAVSPDGKTALTGSWDRTARLWNVATGLPVGPPWPHSSGVMSAAFSSDGATAVTGCNSAALLWRCPAPLAGEVKAVVAWTQLLTGMELDGRGAASVLDAGTWDRRRRALEEAGNPPAAGAGTPERVRAWHRREAEQSQNARQWFAGLWHLDRLITAEPARGDYRLARAAHYGTAGAWDRSLEDLARAAALRPVDWQAWVQLGHRHAESGRWPAAATAFARAVERNPHDVELGYFYACTLVLAGDPARYQQVCTEMLERFRQTRNVNTWYQLAQTCSLAPRGAADPAVPVALAERAVQAVPTFGWYLHTLGMAHYRAGQYGQAVRRLHESSQRDPEWRGQPLNWLALALTEHRLGRAAEARAWWDKVQGWLAQTGAQRRKETLGAYPSLTSIDQLELAILRREVEALLGEANQEKIQPSGRARSNRRILSVRGGTSPRSSTLRVQRYGVRIAPPSR